MSLVWRGLHDTVVSLDSTSVPQDPPPPQMNKIDKKNHILILIQKSLSDYFHILHVVERIALMWNIF